MRVAARFLRGPFASLALLVLVSGLLATGPQAAAQEQIKVVGHLVLENMHVNQMFVQQRGSKFYLYLHRPGKDAFALVDVTKVNKPVLISRNAMKGSSANGRAGNAQETSLAVTVTPEGNPQQAAAAPLPTETVNLVDTSDPQKPKAVKTFKGVTAIYPEDGRKLVYLVNSEGLWIISHHMVQPMPLCTSEDAMNPNADCM